MAAAAPLTEAVHRETIYLTVVDRDRMAVSLIYSVYHSFGSGLASSRFGINFQNRGAGFTLTEGHPNEANGGKRPILLICRSGNRSETAGNALLEAGFEEVYNVQHGFEGELDERHHRNSVSGWRFDGLPWEQC